MYWFSINDLLLLFIGEGAEKRMSLCLYDICEKNYAMCGYIFLLKKNPLKFLARHKILIQSKDWALSNLTCI